MALISKKKRSAELLNVKYLVFSVLFLSTVRPQIESAPTRPNKYYHKVGVDTFRFQFQFPSAKSHFHNAKKVESLGSNVNGGGIKLALRHNIHPAMMIGSTNSTKWMREMVLKNLNRDKYSANAIIAANSTDTNYRLGPSANVPLVSGNPYGANFIVNVGIGTPRKEEIKMILDTATDVSWLLCNYRNGSSSYQRLTCNSCNRQVDGMSCNGRDQCIYQNQFDTRGELEAHMSEDTLWLGSRPFPKFTFGCGYNFRKFNSDPSIGLLGLGRNSLSLPTQAASEYQGKFSYCLPAFLNPNQAGSLRLGHGSIPSTSTFTPLLSNPLARSWYFVGMTGVSVAGERVKISPDVFNFNSRGQGGTIIDSGVLFSRLVKPAYDAFRAAFVKKMGIVLMEPQPGNPLDTCFTYSQDIKTLKIPGIAFHFQNGVRLRIHKEGILTPLSPNVTCLAFRPAGMDGKSIIGSVQQQHYIFSFDEQSKQVGFASVRNCIHTDE